MLFESIYALSYPWISLGRQSVCCLRVHVLVQISSSAMASSASSSFLGGPALDPLDQFYVGFAEDDPTLPPASFCLPPSVAGTPGTPAPSPTSSIGTFPALAPASPAPSSPSVNIPCSSPSSLPLYPFRVAYFRPGVDVDSSLPLSLPKSLFVRYYCFHDDIVHSLSLLFR